MHVHLAGYNVPRVALHGESCPEQFTPEVLSATYARISRDPRSICDIRAEALDDVEKARKSNETIVFDMGHSSIAEHAVFNFDIEDVSRLAIEEIESHRLCSFTEKSQRYVRLDGDSVVPSELPSSLHDTFDDFMRYQTEKYEEYRVKLEKHLAEKHPYMDVKALKGKAKEDARYVMLMTTTGQLGMTINARNLELMIKRLIHSPLQECREIGRRLYKEACMVAPSLLRHLDDDASPTGSGYSEWLCEQLDTENAGRSNYHWRSQMVRLTTGPDKALAEALVFKHTNKPLGECSYLVGGLNGDNLKEVILGALAKMTQHDQPPREFEHVHMTFEAIVSASCFAQLKRHRMCTITTQSYSTELGYEIPPSFKDAGIDDDFKQYLRDADELILKVEEKVPAIKDYFMTNAHCRRVLVTMNLRDFYHFCRMRQDGHAQWSIRELANNLVKEVQYYMPYGTALLCGKDNFEGVRKEVFDEEVQEET